MTRDGCDRYPQHHNQPVDRDNLDELSPPPSNKKLLCIAFVSFQTFAIVQLGASIYAGSSAMLGDSVAMMVDALTYLFNLVAERQKEIYASKLQQQYKFSSPMTSFSRNKMVLQYRKYTCQLELIPPLLSVSTLLVVTVLVLKESIHTLILDRERDASLQSDPNVDLMVIFSFFNLLLDVVNIGCFASANHALGYKTETGTSDEIGVDTGKIATTEAIRGTYQRDQQHRDKNDCDSDSEETTETDDEPLEKAPIDTERTSREVDDYDDDFIRDNGDDSTNLNMCSAYTHVFADTIRSFAVILASLLAKFTTAVTSEVADAAAAVVVSILIFLSLFPLIGGMIQTFKSLIDINRLLEMKESKENEDEEDQVELLRIV